MRVATEKETDELTTKTLVSRMLSSETSWKAADHLATMVLSTKLDKRKVTQKSQEPEEGFLIRRNWTLLDDKGPLSALSIYVLSMIVVKV